MSKNQFRTYSKIEKKKSNINFAFKIIYEYPYIALIFMEHSCGIYSSRIYRRKHINKRDGDKQIIHMITLYCAKNVLKIKYQSIKNIQTRHDDNPQNCP